MHQQRIRLITWLPVLLASLLALALLPSSSLAQNKTVAVLPFAVHGPEDYQYLERAIPDMLSTRLSQGQGLETLSDAKLKQIETSLTGLDQDKASRIGRATGADLVLYGSLTILGQGWSLDASLVESEEGQRFKSFSSSGQKLDQLIPDLESLASNIVTALGGEKAAPKAETAAPPETATQPAQPKKQPARTEKQAAPEKQPSDPSAQAETGPQAPSPGFQQAQPKRQTQRKVWTSPDYAHNFTGLAAADVFGDGRTELIVTDEDDVFIFSVQGKRFVQKEELDPGSFFSCVAVSAGDINGNGRAEIFISGLTSKKYRPKSFVLEYDGQDYRKLVDGSALFYRVVHRQGQEPALYGQELEGNSPFSGRIFRMRAEGDGYVRAETVLSDTQANVLSLAAGRIQPNSAPSLAFYNDSDQIRLVSLSGQPIWSSGETFGGSSLFMHGPKQGQGDPEPKYYLPGRLLVEDIQGNGKAELITFRNFEATGDRLKRLRAYLEGEIVTLIWEGSGLREEWKTQKYKGHIRDLCLADIDNDGTRDLVALLVKKEGRIVFTEPRSQILVYPLTGQSSQ